MQNKLVSIIIRSKDEEMWIGRCLDLIRKQVYTNYEIISVDTGSTDKTLEIVGQYPECRIYKYDGEYKPGAVLNFGCKQARGEYLVFISAHCIPKNEFWLENLIRNLEDTFVAGVYGKQEPTEETNPFDKRDLILTFGLDRKTQWNDPLFNNANSAIKVDLWKKLQFNDEVKNIEDRIWAANMQKQGYCIIYDPEATVFHYHGIHQTGCQVRCEGVNRVLDNIHTYLVDEKEPIDIIKKDSINAVIPFSEKINANLTFDNIVKLFETTVNGLSVVDYVDKVWLLTDSQKLFEYCRKTYKDINVPYLRKDNVHETLLVVLQDFILSQNIRSADSILLAEIIFFVNNLSCYYNKLCEEYLRTKHSSGIWVSKNYNTIFRKTSEFFYRLDEDIHRYRGYKIPFYEAHDGLGKVISVKNILANYFHDSNTLLLEKDNKDLIVQISSDRDIAFINKVVLNRRSPAGSL